MKRYFSLFFLLLPMLLIAQDQVSDSYLFDEFQKGEIIYKTGGKNKGLFNYDIKREKLVFMSGTEVMELAEPSTVASINIGNWKLEHVKDGTFYEMLPVGNITLYVRWRAKQLSKAKSGAYGIASHNSSSRSAAILEVDRGYKLDRTEDSQIKPNYTFYLKTGKNYSQINSANSLAKVFKGNGANVREYVEKERINFSDLSDVRKAITYCNQFVKE